MTPLTLSKSQIKLEQVDFSREIAIRRLIGGLNQSEREAIIEIVEGPISFSKSRLTLPSKELDLLLSRLKEIGLLKEEGAFFILDKEMRRRVELQLERFSEEFRPDIATFISFLKAVVPLHLLPLWYVIPRSAETIDKALIDKFFLTPELYERYLSDLTAEPGMIGDFAKIALRNESIAVVELQKRFNLTDEALERALLHAELHMVLFHGFDEKGRVLKPLHERREYLKELKERFPQKVNTVEGDEGDFAFLKKRVPLEQHHLIKEEALHYYRSGESLSRCQEEFGELASHLAIRVIENSLRYVKECGWVFFEDFVRFVRVPAPLFDTVRLMQRGKRYTYAFPVYTELQKRLIEKVIFERLFEAGMVRVATSNGKKCFRLSDFGLELLA